MIKIVKFSIAIALALLLQVTVFPVYLEDSFRPNLLMVAVVYLGLRVTMRGGWCLAFFIGLLQDCFSGLYLGLNGFTFLAIYLFLKTVADYLYADSRFLMLLVVFVATVVSGLLQLLLLLLYSTADGLYATLLPQLLPQALVNTLCASLLTLYSAPKPAEEA
ncbi:MAG TPA: rod shape-determining protein MreD, partial [Geobacteraceae bacterium]